jgi:hypothetical protein
VAAYLDRAYLDGYRYVCVEACASDDGRTALTYAYIHISRIFNVAAEADYSPDAFRGRVEHFPVQLGDTAILSALIAAARCVGHVWVCLCLCAYVCVHVGGCRRVCMRACVHVDLGEGAGRC